ncbi:hypothetical protein JW887_07120 [Candidatus Dojkabacteria bacterium]|nr:hypothetical protein [Candidatus Dojkabacteria bacterium]
MIRYIFNISIVLLFLGCTPDSDLMKYSLKTAGDNKQELLKVIEHYSQKKSDSLKLKAAYFLIENMWLHGSFYGAKVEQTNRVFDEIKKLKITQTEIREEDILKSIDDVLNNMDKDLPNTYKTDNQQLSAKYIISNIESAFSIYNKSPWKSSVSFQDFCEYILPYRIRSEQPEYWRDFLFTRQEQLKEVIPHCDNLDSVFNYHTLTTYYKMEASDFIKKYKYDQNFSQLEITLKGDCQDYCSYEIYHLRAAGIPATYDYIPNWGNRPAAEHTMVGLANRRQASILATNENSIRNSSNPINSASTKPIPYHFTHEDLPANLYVQYVKTIPKVYRNTWSAQKDKIDIYNTIDEKQLFRPLLQLNTEDVTDRYLETGDINVTMSQSFRDYQIAYLSVFSRKGWIPVTYSIPDANGKLVFEKLGKNILYLPTVCSKGEIIPFADPVILNSDGETEIISCSENQFINMTLNRKFPYFSYNCQHTLASKGIVFEGANLKDFCDAKRIQTVDYYPFVMSHAQVTEKKKFKYIRCLPPKSGRLSLAEMQIFGVINNDTVKLSGTSISPVSGEEEQKKALDNNILTYFRSRINDEWVGLELEKPIQITSIEFCPKNDANNVIPEHEYELLYWNNKWISCGKKVATTYYVDFNNVPKGTIYWLKCLTEGKEERIFTYENGMQMWW